MKVKKLGTYQEWLFKSHGQFGHDVFLPVCCHLGFITAQTNILKLGTR